MAFISIRNPLYPSPEDGHAVPYEIIPETMLRNPQSIWNRNNLAQSPNMHLSYYNWDDKVSSNKSPELYSCHLCQMSFESVSCLEMLAHSCEEPYQKISGETFYEGNGLENCIGSRTVSEILECKVCQKLFFTTKDGLKIHMRMHTQLSLLQCEVCEMAFYRGHDLAVHMRIHSRETIVE